MAPQHINVNLALQPDMACPKCGSLYFQEVSKLKILAPLLIGAPKTSLYAIRTWVCLKCNYEFTMDEAEVQLKEKTIGNPALSILQKPGEA